MTVRVYKSTDAGAPQLSGTNGSMIEVLSAVLVDGYGTGADLKPGAGWTRPFTGTNKAVYRNSPTGGTGHYFRIQDDGEVRTGIAYITGVRGYTNMSDVDTGDNPFPALSTPQGNHCWYKSGTSIPWVVVADQYTMYIFIGSLGSVTSIGYALYGMGDYFSFVPSHSYKSFCTGAICDGAYNRVSRLLVSGSASYNTNSGGGAFSGGASQVGSIFLSAARLNLAGSTSTDGPVGTFGPAYPHPITGKLHTSKLYIGSDSTALTYGYFRGLSVSLHTSPLNHLDTFTVGATNPKTMQCMFVRWENSVNGGTLGQINVEISDTWEVSA